MDTPPILPRPVFLTNDLLRKWLGKDEARRFRFTLATRSGKNLALEAVEAAIRQRYPDGNYPPPEELLAL